MTGETQPAGNARRIEVQVSDGAALGIANGLRGIDEWAAVACIEALVRDRGALVAKVQQLREALEAQPCAKPSPSHMLCEEDDELPRDQWCARCAALAFSTGKEKP